MQNCGINEFHSFVLLAGTPFELSIPTTVFATRQIKRICMVIFSLQCVADEVPLKWVVRPPNYNLFAKRY